MAIAGLKSNETQEYLVERLLDELISSNRVQLLGGLLLDNVDAMQPHETAVLRLVAEQASKSGDDDMFGAQMSVLRAQSDRGTESRRNVRRALSSACKSSRGAGSLPLIALALGERGVAYRYGRDAIRRESRPTSSLRRDGARNDSNSSTQCFRRWS